jgi:hypothetical protein
MSSKEILMFINEIVNELVSHPKWYISSIIWGEINMQIYKKQHDTDNVLGNDRFYKIIYNDPDILNRMIKSKIIYNNHHLGVGWMFYIKLTNKMRGLIIENMIKSVDINKMKIWMKNFDKQLKISVKNRIFNWDCIFYDNNPKLKSMYDNHGTRYYGSTNIDRYLCIYIMLYQKIYPIYYVKYIIIDKDRLNDMKKIWSNVEM